MLKKCLSQDAVALLSLISPSFCNEFSLEGQRISWRLTHSFAISSSFLTYHSIQSIGLNGFRSCQFKDIKMKCTRVVGFRQGVCYKQ